MYNKLAFNVERQLHIGAQGLGAHGKGRKLMQGYVFESQCGSAPPKLPMQ